MNLTNDITIQRREEHEYLYQVPLLGENVVSNWRLRGTPDNYIETRLTLLTQVVGDSPATNYYGERHTTIFDGRKFVRNDVGFWTYAESIIATGIAPADLVDLFSPAIGGYYNFTEDFTYSPVAAASDVDEKYIQLDAHLYQNNPLFDYGYAYT